MSRHCPQEPPDHQQNQADAPGNRPNVEYAFSLNYQSSQKGLINITSIIDRVSSKKRELEKSIEFERMTRNRSRSRRGPYGEGLRKHSSSGFH